MNDELEPAGPEVKAASIARELRAIADLIERVPELADEDNPIAAAEKMLYDLDGLDIE